MSRSGKVMELFLRFWWEPCYKQLSHPHTLPYHLPIISVHCQVDSHTNSVIPIPYHTIYLSFQSIAKRAFKELLSLKQLYLEGNAITGISADSFDEMLELTELRLNSTSFLCDCELSWLPTWIVTKGFQVRLLSSVKY